MLDLPPNREFNKTELAEHAGVTRQTVGNYTDLLCEVELIEEVPDTSPRRYRVADSDVVGDRANVTREVLDEHYDRRSQREKMEQRRKFLDDI